MGKRCLTKNQKGGDMPEPVTSTSVAAGAVGISALLVSWFGPVGGDVALVLMSALAGCYISLASLKNRTTQKTIEYLVTGILVALILSWTLAQMVSGIWPSLSGAYLPSTIAFLIGMMLDKAEAIKASLLNALRNAINGGDHS